MVPLRLLGPIFISLALLVGAPAHDAPSTGTIEGVVVFTGKLVPPTVIMTTDGGFIQHSDHVVEAKSRGLRYVMAMLDGAPAQPKLERAKPVLVDQRDMLFLPRVVAVQHGQAVRFDNSDLCNHSVMTASIVKEDQFSIFVAPTRPLDHVFALQKHPVQVGCSLHGWMRAWVYVVPHPWFAVTDAQGRFKIERVPAGKHVLWLRHPDTGRQQRRAVEVMPGARLELKVEWPGPPPERKD